MECCGLLLVAPEVADGSMRGALVDGSSRCRRTAVLAGLESSAPGTILPYGESYPLPPPPSASDLFDRARRRLPEDDELELLALLGSRAVGVSIAAIGILAAAVVIIGLASSAVGAGRMWACAGAGVCVAGRDIGADADSPLAAAAAAAATLASSLAACSAFVGRPRLRFGGGSFVG